MYLAPLGAGFQWGNALRILVAFVTFGAVKAGVGRWQLICCLPREPLLMGFGRKDGTGALNHAWRVVELYRVEQRAGRLKPGLSVYLDLVGARLQREAGAGDEMRALAEWGNRLAHVGETRHAEFVRGRYDAEQAVEFRPAPTNVCGA